MGFKTWIIVNGLFAILWLISAVMCFIGDVYFWIATMFVFVIILQITSRIEM